MARQNQRILATTSILAKIAFSLGVHPGTILKGKSQELSVDFCRNKICLSYSKDLTTVFSKPVTRGNFMIRFHKRGEISSRLNTRVTVGASLRAWESMAGNS